MNHGVQQKQESLFRDSLAVDRRPVLRIGGKTCRVGLSSFGLLSSSAIGANAVVGLGSVASFFVLDGSTITNAGYHA